MIKGLAVFVMGCTLLAGCKKSNSSSTTTVEYQVSATNSSTVDIDYNNAIGNKTETSATNNWVMDLTITQKPYNASIQASSTSPFSSIQTTCTVTILVNGTIEKTATVSSNTTAVAEADFTVQ